MIYILISLGGTLIASIICNVMFYFRSVRGDMIMTWNHDDGCWDANFRIPINVDYLKKKKVILTIKSGTASRE